MRPRLAVTLRLRAVQQRIAPACDSAVGRSKDEGLPERKRAEGKTKREALRSLKGRLARKIHRLLSMPAVDSDPVGLNVAISGRCLT